MNKNPSELCLKCPAVKDVGGCPVGRHVDAYVRSFDGSIVGMTIKVESCSPVGEGRRVILQGVREGNLRGIQSSNVGRFNWDLI